MLDAALIKECADPSVKPAIVEQFVLSVGATDPLTVTVQSGGRLVLVPKATTVDEAMATVRQYAGQAVVRVGLTQLPAGVGVRETADLQPNLLDACENLRRGTSIFAKILRMVAKWYGNPKSEDVFPQIVEDALHAWKTGEFEGVNVFQAEDFSDEAEPSLATFDHEEETQVHITEEAAPSSKQSEHEQAVGAAEMRINLKRLGGN